MSISANWTADGNQTGAQLGHAVGGADVDAVGCSDLLIGAPRHDTAAIDAGQVRVYFTVPSAIATWAQTIDGTQPNGRLGSSVASAGDLQGDGFEDFIVGEEGYVPPGGAGAAFGRALVYVFGQPPRTSPLLRQEWAREGTQPSSFLGRSVAGAGDVNGDGLDDLIIGAPGLSAQRRLDTGSAIVVW